MKTTHTHELRLLHYRDYQFVIDKRKEGQDIEMFYHEVLIKGTKEECHNEVIKRAKEIGCGTGLLYNNGGYSIVDLEEERISKIKQVAPDLLEALQKIHKELTRDNFDIDDIDELITISYIAIKKATN